MSANLNKDLFTATCLYIAKRRSISKRIADVIALGRALNAKIAASGGIKAAGIDADTLVEFGEVIDEYINFSCRDLAIGATPVGKSIEALDALSDDMSAAAITFQNTLSKVAQAAA